MNRQVKWKVKQYQAGNCINCGKTRNGSPYKRHCVDCRRKLRVLDQIRLGREPWEAGKAGKPPYVALGTVKVEKRIVSNKTNRVKRIESFEISDTKVNLSDENSI
jgi:hypothetical protein